MSSDSRISNTIRNSSIALVEQFITTIVSFICRTVFIYTLGKKYLGYSGLFSDILTLLSLAELGVGTAILYSMYKPVALDNKKEVSALLGLYKRVYNGIGVVITVVGLCLIPFLDFFVSGITDTNDLSLIYVLYLLNTSVGYFFAYKKSILITYQKNYIASIIYVITILFQNVFQILFLFLTHNFIVYLIIQVLCTCLNNLFISLYVDLHYSFLKKYRKEKVSGEQKKNIFINIKAMFASKISSAVVTSTDNIFISKFVSTITLGLYSNYTLFVTMIKSVISKIFESITGSVGNLIALESREKVYDTFKKIWFINFWLVSMCTILLFVLVNPFIELWIGKGFVLDRGITCIICLNMYMRLIRNTFIIFSDAYGLFKELKWKCIFEAVINFVVSLILVYLFKLGIVGVLLGTFISNITTNFWYEPYLLFKKKFNKSMYEYFTLFLKYFIITVLVIAIATFIFNNVYPTNSWFSLIFKAIILTIVINAMYVIVFYNTEEFRYLLSQIKLKIKN